MGQVGVGKLERVGVGKLESQSGQVGESHWGQVGERVSWGKLDLERDSVWAS